MRPLIIAEIVTLETVDFLSLVMYGTDGFYLDAVIKQYENEQQIIEEIREILRRFKFDDCELHTSNKVIYVMTLSVVGIASSLKRKEETTDATQRVLNDRKTLIELWQVPLLVPPPTPPKLAWWKTAIINQLEKIINKLNGEVI